MTGTARAVRHSAAGEAALRWVEGWADHVRKRFGSRALVSVRIGGGEPLALSHVYALESGGLVLVATCGHEHEHGHGAAPEHHRAVPMKVPRGNGGAQDGGAAAPAEGGHAHAAAGQAIAAHAAAAHAHGPRDACTDCVELWLDSPEQAVFEARSIEAGKLCTGFGYLGLSRTPHILIARGTEPPPKIPHHQHENF